MFKIKLCSRRLIRGKILKISLLPFCNMLVFVCAIICLTLSILCFFYGGKRVFEEYLFYSALLNYSFVEESLPYLLLFAFVLLLLFGFSMLSYTGAVFFCRTSKLSVPAKSFFSPANGAKYMLLTLMVFLIKAAVFAAFLFPGIACTLCTLIFINIGIDKLSLITGVYICLILIVSGTLAALFSSKATHLCYVSYYKNFNQKPYYHIKAGLAAAKGSYAKLVRAELSVFPWKILYLFIFTFPFAYSYVRQTNTLVWLSLTQDMP